MTSAQHDTLAELILQNIPRDLVMGIEDALQVGAIRGHAPSIGMSDGHKPSVIGHMRHFHMNETFHDALSVGGANPSRIRGNKIVIGMSGIFSIARFNITAGARGGHRSKTRREMAKANRAVEPLVQPSLFGGSGTDNQSDDFLCRLIQCRTISQRRVAVCHRHRCSRSPYDKLALPRVRS